MHRARLKNCHRSRALQVRDPRALREPVALAIALHFEDGMGRAVSYSPDALSGAYALVVDAEKERRVLVSGILRYCGALVTAVETPDEALAVMRLLKPDVVVVDFSPPHDAAVDFIAQVRALAAEDGGTVPVIAVGLDAATADVTRAHGFDIHLARPLEPWTLCRTVGDLLET